MEVIKTKLDGVLIIEPQVFGDKRGFFFETYNQKNYFNSGIKETFVQDNLSYSAKNVLRGLHWQAPPHAQGKLVSVLRGKVLDVAVDIRFDSPTFGQYIAEELSAENKKQLWIPAGFAHAFLVLEDKTLFSYKCTDLYAPDHERAIMWNDPDINIDWPVKTPVVSEKDQKNKLFKEITKEFFYKK